jgi:hypothetical protein
LIRIRNTNTGLNVWGDGWKHLIILLLKLKEFLLKLIDLFRGKVNGEVCKSLLNAVELERAWVSASAVVTEHGHNFMTLCKSLPTVEVVKEPMPVLCLRLLVGLSLGWFVPINQKSPTWVSFSCKEPRTGKE